jgi:hypothetical protein
MERNHFELNKPDLINNFSGQKLISKADLRNFYHLRSPNLTEAAFRRILYMLEKQHLLLAIGRGIYTLQDPLSSQLTQKKKFAPTLSPNVKKLNDEIHEVFPYLGYLIWETKILHEFMVHQPGQNQIILETEKDAEDSVFNQISESYPGKTFLDPDRIMIERYVFQHPEAILISRLISQTPMGEKINGVPYAKIEKILVDILVDDKKYFIFQGQELVNIFENVFANYRIDEKSLQRYARRRNAIPKLKLLLLNHPKIEFSQFDEVTT